ncbi:MULTISPECIES: flavodoxin-dependent (E)-4-hydroxy-3-methylbut-2-enyl-diphosphate synthase [Carboxydothermus]|uniref:4-hydroxy-3-methylbut-2-en-1-yl diphosphate synthase (flavodoxin) n=2 Tax=Carboxydothermus TaxID=129957 RepID=Q3AB88_CARHZ|nr:MULTISPECIES: flavodoxin-dependent (E)-4-hydroxy-3-methylbut-2-enyl-diphosphate synthase [Carboxydothermus]ABB16075.1 1-hydroxy-2-methyl-2-(E)-butenyl 4-diphosphate synthase [Carboxydothermus hydrogenoformans Z-2901]NYE58525.1 (E)-4-hydroxy-3-methylbut-2-enyl-diphosphate synthase [Carboxydothermus ferrireducens DSM 11255]
MLLPRRKTKTIFIGTVPVGGDAPITVQSMTNTDTRDWQKTLRQIKRLKKAGCELVRVAVPDQEAARALKLIVEKSPLPVIADIHFDYKLALMALEAGVHGLRLNPGNIGSAEKVRIIVREAKNRRVPIRIGVNAGSLEKKLVEKYGGITPEAMVESALHHVGILEDMGFDLIKISLKASDIPLMLAAYRLLAKKVDYPFHIGVTEAGPRSTGIIKSAVGIGALLAEGIGDTLRVSLTADPVEEVKIGFQILKALGLREYGAEVISCPTCGRTQVDIIKIAREVEKFAQNVKKPLKIAVMGCVVNGPGEAREADIGIAGGRGEALLFKKGKVVRKIGEEEILKVLKEEIKKLEEEV